MLYQAYLLYGDLNDKKYKETTLIKCRKEIASKIKCINLNDIKVKSLEYCKC